MTPTPDTPPAERLAVLLARAVVYARRPMPTPAETPAAVATPDGEWTPTPAQWAAVCERTARLVAETTVPDAHYGRVPYPAPPTRDTPCGVCDGNGVTDEAFAQPVDEGPYAALLVDVFCPLCRGCGDGAHAQCAPPDHADHDPELWDDYMDEGYEAPAPDPHRCPSCQGRGWWALDGTTDVDADGGGTVAATLRMPCGCAAGRIIPAPV